MSDTKFFMSVCDLLAMEYLHDSREEVLRMLEDVVSIAATGNLPDRFTTNVGKENETPM